MKKRKNIKGFFFISILFHGFSQFPCLIESMLNWLSKLCSHTFSAMGSMNVPPGGFNGIGRALFKISKLNESENKKSVEEEEEEGIGED